MLSEWNDGMILSSTITGYCTYTDIDDIDIDDTDIDIDDIDIAAAYTNTLVRWSWRRKEFYPRPNCP